jgi:hypothetical protein
MSPKILCIVIAFAVRICRKNGARVEGKRAARGRRGILRVRVVGKRARVPECKYMHYILEDVSMAARMEGKYSMTLKMGTKGTRALEA